MPHSSIDPAGPVVRVLDLLDQIGDSEAVLELRLLLQQRAFYREESETFRSKADELTRNVSEARRIARYCFQRWRSLAMIQKSREELAKIDRTISNYSWLNTTTA